MATPLKINNVGGTEIKEFTTAEENYIAYQIGLHLATSSSIGAYNITTNASHDSVGDFTNTFFNEPVGTHPSTSITSGSTTTTIYQNLNVAIETDSDVLSPIMWVDSGGQTGFKQMPDADLNSAVDRYISTIFTNDYPGVFKLASSSPGPDYSVHLSSVFTDTRTDGTSVAYNIYRRDSFSAPTTVRPLYVRDDGGFDGIQAMTDRQIKFSFGQRAKTRVGASKIGTYQLRTSAQGAPTDPGTWVSAGSATDTKQTTADVEYTRDSTTAFARNYTNTYTKNYTAVYTKPYTGVFTSPYARNYTGVFTSNYQRAYTGVFQSNYTKEYTGVFTSNYTAAYTGVFATNYATNYTGVFNANYTKRYTGNYNRAFLTNYQKYYTSVFLNTFNTNYTKNYDIFYTRNYAPNYTSDLAYQKMYTNVYAGTYTTIEVNRGMYTGPTDQYSRLLPGGPAGPNTSYLVGYQRIYTGTRTYQRVTGVYTSTYFLGPGGFLTYSGGLGGGDVYPFGAISFFIGPSFPNIAQYLLSYSRPPLSYQADDYYTGTGLGQFTNGMIGYSGAALYINAPTFYESGSYLGDRPPLFYSGSARSNLLAQYQGPQGTPYNIINPDGSVYLGPAQYYGSPIVSNYTEPVYFERFYSHRYAADVPIAYEQTFYTKQYEVLFTGQDFRPLTFYTGTSYARAYLLRYDRAYAGTYTNQYTSGFLTNYQRAYTFQYISVTDVAYQTSYTHVDTINYQRAYTHVDNIAYARAYTHVDTINYVGTYTHIDTIDYAKAYTHVDTINYSTAYTHVDNVPYTSIFTNTFNAQYQTDYIGNFIGNFAGETIQSGSQTEETYTLYVRIG